MDEANEKIVSLFVEKEVLADMTELVNYVFDTATRSNCPPFDPESSQAKEDAPSVEHRKNFSSLTRSCKAKQSLL